MGRTREAEQGVSARRRIRPPAAAGQRKGWFVYAKKRSGMPAELTIHDLRHTAASLAIASGANVKAVQRMLGHASAAMTLDVYADSFDDDLDAVSTALHVEFDTSWRRVERRSFAPTSSQSEVPCLSNGSAE